ncbi:HNH endonuclease [Halapricum desulfuricans]|uniref:DNA-binding transcriptional regulator, HxlR family n=1 Tax=Halapricum desulfuricans TaxID=2841257 RepID=A0A897NF82_9EURY|nr:HNH endonuclease [Halapricum desulfuricans]QSG09589.1 DNA-binding transcriptional regulator, HxlR family [Halapricum desulfuricans]
MSDTKALADDDSTDNYPSDDTARGRSDAETVNAETRKQMLEAYNYRCQNCGTYGPQNGGMATLQVHHLDRDPDQVDVHDPANLTVLCHACHTWYHQQPEPETLPVELTAADEREMLPQDREILQLLAANGPLRTGDIADRLSVDQSTVSIRDRLWQLMGLDKVVEGREHPLVDKDIETGKWGLPEQIEHSARGHIPSETKALLQRMEDELVRQALERGCNQETVAEVFDVTRRTVATKEKRARAYDFPIDAFRDGGRPPKSQPTDERLQHNRSDNATMGDSAAGADTAATASGEVESEPEDESDDIDAAADGDADAPVETWTRHHSASDPVNGDPDIASMVAELDPDELHEQLPESISPVQLLTAVLTASRS